MNTEVAPERRSEVSVILDELDTSIGTNTDLSNKLCDRIAVVVSDAPPIAEMEDEPASSVPMVNALRRLTRQVQDTNRFMDTLISRIEL